jgi:hypothetical protein
MLHSLQSLKARQKSSHLTQALHYQHDNCPSPSDYRKKQFRQTHKKCTKSFFPTPEAHFSYFSLFPSFDWMFRAVDGLKSRLRHCFSIYANIYPSCSIISHKKSNLYSPAEWQLDGSRLAYLPGAWDYVIADPAGNYEMPLEAL